ncbi:MAG: SpoIID/LytB domain-containing protein [Acidimicrobiales bacterium]
MATLPVVGAPRRLLLAVATCVTVVAGTLVVAPAAPAAAYPYPNVTLDGHGWGHGMGMGQWGAFGYAVAGTPYQQILQHYYGTLAAGGSTTVGGLGNGWSDASPVTVAITANAGADVIVTSSSPFTVPGPGSTTVSVPAGSGARFQLAAPGTAGWNVFTSSGGCGGNGNWGAPTVTGVVNPVAAPVTPAAFPSDGHLASEVLQLCQPGGNLLLRGTVGGTVNSNDQARTVNVVPLGQYVADVTPSESPSYWGTIQPTDAGGQAGPQGEPWGFQALEAQAVAARSYVMSTYGNLQGYFGYADICDSTACQDYPGTANEGALTDAAVNDTSAMVVVLPNGAAATTQSSSAPGGYSAPGTFAGVVDDGDAVCLPNACNAHHAWQAQVPVSAIDALYPQLGTLLSVNVSQRNGLGDYGGRVTQMSLVGSNQTVVLTGNGFAAAFAGNGVQSNWFNVVNEPSGGVAGYWVLGADGGVFSYGTAQFYGSMGGSRLNQPMVAMAATADRAGYFMVASDGGIFAFGDAHFYGSMGGTKLNRPMVGMAATPDGQGYWLVASDGGVFAFGDAAFFGSTGAMHLNQPVVGMASTPDGRGYWLVASDGGVFAFGDAAFFGSTGAIHLQQPMVGMASTPDGRGYWLVASDGGVFAFGDAVFEGSLPGAGVNATATALLPTQTGKGYLIVTAGGQVVPFGDAPQFGEPATSAPGAPSVGGATVPQ